jgi:hypothetical protein
MAIDRPAAIDAALGFEPEQAEDGEAPTCLMREECRRSRQKKSATAVAARRSRQSRLPARSSIKSRMAAIEHGG